MIELHMCRYGCSYLKPTLIATNSIAFVELSKLCQCTCSHDVLRGKVKILTEDVKPQRFWKSTLAAEYPAELCHSWA